MFKLSTRFFRPLCVVLLSVFSCFCLAQSTTPVSKTLLTEGAQALLMESYEMDIHITSSLSTKTDIPVITPKEEPGEFSLFMQRLLETSYNLMGNQKYSARLSVDQSKKKLSTVILFSSESENLKTNVRIPLLWNFGNNQLVLGMSEFTPMLFPEKFGDKSYQDKNIRIDFSNKHESTASESEENSIDTRQEIIEGLNKITNALPDHMISDIPLDAKDKAVSGQRKIRMSMTLSDLIALSKSDLFESQNNSDSDELVNEDAEKESPSPALSLPSKDNLSSDQADQPFVIDYTFNKKNQLVRIYSNVNSAMQDKLLFATWGIGSNREVAAVYDITVRYKKRPSLPFDPAEKDIIDFPQNEDHIESAVDTEETIEAEPDVTDVAVEASAAE